MKKAYLQYSVVRHQGYTSLEVDWYSFKNVRIYLPIALSIKYVDTTTILHKNGPKNLKRVMVRDGICGVSDNALKDSCSHFKFILYHPIRTKNTEVNNFQC